MLILKVITLISNEQENLKTEGGVHTLVTESMLRHVIVQDCLLQKVKGKLQSLILIQR